MRIVDAEIKGNWTLRHFILFSLSFLLLTGCSSAQCGNCDDNNPCSRDWCNGTQCLHEPQICDQIGTIEMTGQETTDEGGPIGFAPAYGTEDDESIISPRDALFNPSSISVPDTNINCDDSNPCTDDSYDPTKGECVHSNNAAPCDDGKACTTSDTCSGGSCNGIEISCDDNNPCTDDRCDPATGCVYTPIVCDDNDACTDDRCDPETGKCVNENNAAP